jgi:hypothetical protein
MEDIDGEKHFEVLSTNGDTFLGGAITFAEISGAAIFLPFTSTHASPLSALTIL